MLVYHDEADEACAEDNGRYVPYTYAAHDSDGGYYDFVTHPDLIPTALEDFLPFASQPAIHRFYRLLHWLNSEASILESTDCLLRPPLSNTTPHLGGGAALQIIGRIMLIYRNHAYNVSPQHSAMFADVFHEETAKVDPEWDMERAVTPSIPRRFVCLGPEPIEGVTTGSEFCIRFWVWAI